MEDNLLDGQALEGVEGVDAGELVARQVEGAQRERHLHQRLELVEVAQLVGRHVDRLHVGNVVTDDAHHRLQHVVTRQRRVVARAQFCVKGKPQSSN